MTSTLPYPQPSGIITRTPENIVRRVLTALNRRDIADAANQSSDRFTFVDHALSFTFTDKRHLTDFLHKATHVLEDNLFEVESVAICGEQVVAQWTLSGTQHHDPGPGFQRRTRVFVKGVSIALVTDGAISSWADYYDAKLAWRFSLAGVYAEY